MLEENYKHINEWATNKKVFELQLQSNESEFYNGFPHHWNCYINFLKTLNLETFKILDAGCGCGFFKKLTEKPSHYTIYKAYDLIDTYRYEHNYENLKSIFQKYGYKSVRDETKNNFLLKKQNS